MADAPLVQVGPARQLQFATDDCGTAGHAPIVKLGYSADGVATALAADAVGLAVNPAKLDVANDEVATGASSAATGGYASKTALSVNTGFDATVVKASAGRLYGYVITNTDAAKLAFVKFYNKATAPDPSADSALLMWQAFCPPTPTAVTAPNMIIASFAFPHGLAFSAGIGYVITQLPGTDETAVDANDVAVNIIYK